MTLVALRKVVSVLGGGTPRKSVAKYYGGGIPWVTPKDMKQPVIDDSLITLTPEGVKNSPAKLVPSGSVLLVVRSGVLKHTLPVALASKSVTLNQDMKALVPTERIDASYLARLIQDRQPQVLSWVRATTADNFPIQNLLDLEFDLPPLPEQRRIAAILDQADAIRAKRRQVLAHLDILTQSIFQNMFESGSFPLIAAEQLMPDMRNGVSPSKTGRNPALVLTLSAITQGDFDPAAVKEGYFDVDPPHDKRVTAGDFLMCRGNGNKELVGVGAYSRDSRVDLVFPDTVIAGRVDTNRVSLAYLNAAWRQPAVRRQIEAAARTTNGTYKVNQKSLSSIKVALPPADLQREFGDRMERIQGQRTAVQRGLDTDDELFTSLQSRAFRGEL